MTISQNYQFFLYCFKKPFFTKLKKKNPLNDKSLHNKTVVNHTLIFNGLKKKKTNK